MPRFAGIIDIRRGRARGNRVSIPHRLADGYGFTATTLQFLPEIALKAPFGYGNSEPVVGMWSFTLRKQAVVNSRHLRLHLAWNGGERVEACAWDRSEWGVESAARYKIALMLQLSGNGESRFRIPCWTSCTPKARSGRTSLYR